MKRTVPNVRSRRVVAHVRRLRALRGITVEDLTSKLTAVGCPVRRATWTNWENGVCLAGGISVDLLLALAEVLDVPPLSLVGDDDCPTCKGAPPEGFICAMCGTEDGGVS